MHSDARSERDRIQELLSDIDRARPDRAPRPSAFVGTVYNAGSIPTTSMKYFAVHPGTVGGAEVEGGSGGVTGLPAEALVLVLGSVVPVAGDNLVCYQVGDRWVAEKGAATGGSGPPISTPCCSPALIPRTLTVVDPLQGCTITWNATSSSWIGGYLATGVNGWRYPCNLSVGSTYVQYELFCNTSTFVWTVIITTCTGGCTIGGTFALLSCVDSSDFSTCSIINNGSGDGPCAPLAQSFNFTSVACSPFNVSRATVPANPYHLQATSALTIHA